jgi:hypothetical protein
MPTMSSNDAALESRPWRLSAVVAGLVGLLAAALFSGAFDGGSRGPRERKWRRQRLRACASRAQAASFSPTAANGVR